LRLLSRVCIHGLAPLSLADSNTGENTPLQFAPLKEQPVTSAHSKSDIHPLDAQTGGVFSAPTSGERSARVREWLATNPSAEHMQEVFKDLSGRDKGAAKLLREKLDELKRAKNQEVIAVEWADKAQTLLAASKLNIADALAWQRDAAKAGAPLSREPLASLKVQVAARIKGIEDLQHRVQVQREAAVLLAQRIELLSTKPWRDAQAAFDALAKDVPHWQAQAQALPTDANWNSIEIKFPPLLESSTAQLTVVWEAFQSALAQAVVAAEDASAALPPVTVWADELRTLRGVSAPAAPAAGKPRIDPEIRAQSHKTVLNALQKLEQEVAQGHGKSSAGAANALRQALKDHGRHIDSKLDHQAHMALGAAGELEGWQRWRADQLRQELVAKAEDLFETVTPRGPRRVAETSLAGQVPPPSPTEAADTAAVETPVIDTPTADAAALEAPPIEQAQIDPAQTQPAAADAQVEQGLAVQAPAAVRRPRFGGRKMQDSLRTLREQWKQTDQGGPPNHALWKRFDEACNEAYKVVEVWLDKIKTEAVENRAQRLVMVEEIKTWAAENATAKDGDWKGFNRILGQFEARWRDAGHLSEKAFNELQPVFKQAIMHAAQPLLAVQKQSLERRHAMIDEALALGAMPVLRIDAVRALQQRWQAEAQQIPVERKQEQKLWDAFRKPIDDAFNRKTEERTKDEAALGERDRSVLEAAKALEAANASGDATRIRTAIAGLEAALRGQAQAAAVVAQNAATPAEKEVKLAVEPENTAQAAIENAATGDALDAAPAATPDASDTAQATEETPAVQAPAPAAPPKPTPKPVVAMRGDDRPGMKKAEAAPVGRGGKFGDRKGPGAGGSGGRDSRGPRPSGDNRFEPMRPEGRGDRGPRNFAPEAPRLGDSAFRAQREALEHAEMALKKLAAQAHGESLTGLLSAWQQRKADSLPSTQELGRAVPAALRTSWSQTLAKDASGEASEALLRLEMASEVPTPAEHITARRALQLKLLTQRNAPTPAETWGQDTAKVLATAHDEANARRLQAVLRNLLKR
jgi:ATP-dependent RNA helicase SUPV3L1/SUV3